MVSNQDLINALNLLIENIRMYIETLEWLKNHIEKPDHWDTLRNAILDSHLIHTRLLIYFLTMDEESSRKDDDRYAAQYFIGVVNNVFPIQNDFLEKFKEEINKNISHLTLRRSKSPYRSDAKYEVFKVSNVLIPELRQFFRLVPESRINLTIKQNSLIHLDSVKINENINKSVSPST